MRSADEPAVLVAHEIGEVEHVRITEHAEYRLRAQVSQGARNCCVNRHPSS
jgi:hypothetical protein